LGGEKKYTASITESACGTQNTEDRRIYIQLKWVVTKGTEYFVSLYMCAVLTADCSVLVNSEELIGTTELCHRQRHCINLHHYNRRQLYTHTHTHIYIYIYIYAVCPMLYDATSDKTHPIISKILLWITAYFHNDPGVYNAR